MSTQKVAVITGASSGIGASLATMLAADGYAVVIAARRTDRLHRTAEGVRAAGGTALVVPCDITQRNQAEALIHTTVRTFGHIDVLINNAGQGHFASIEDTSDQTIERMFAVNVFPLWYTTRPALGYMKPRRSGHIINIASIAGKLGYPYNSAYVAAKHAVVGFTHALRLELVETGVEATVVCPAGVATEWATSTEGGPILPIFSEAGPIIKKIAAERGISLPQVQGVMSAEEVALAIVRCIAYPVAELYTHAGSYEFAVLAARNREQAEQHQLPVALGERVVYDRIKKQSP